MKKYKVTKDVIIAAQRGDQKAFGTLYYAFRDRFVDGVFDGNDELYNIMMTNVFRTIGRFDANKPGYFHNFLRKCSINLLINSKTKTKEARNNVQFVDYDQIQLENTDKDSGLIEVVMKKIEEIKKNDREKELFFKYFFEQYTYTKLSQEYGITRQRVEQIISATIKKLKKILKKEDFFSN